MTSSTTHSSAHGFSLIELMVVVAIVAILAALAPMLTSGAILDRQLYNAAVQLQQDLLLVQNKAITYSSGGPGVSVAATRFVMRLYLNTNAFAYQTTVGGASPSGSSPTAGTGIVVRTMPSALGFPAALGQSSLGSVTYGPSASPTVVNTGSVDLVFDNQGYAYWANNGGSLPSSYCAGSITLTNRTASRRIHIEISVIGRVSVGWAP